MIRRLSFALVISALAVAISLALVGQVVYGQSVATPRNQPRESVGNDQVPWVWMKNLLFFEDATLQHARVSGACKMVRYTTAADQSVKGSGGTICGFLAVNGTTTVTVWDNAGATCASGGTQRSGVLTLTAGRFEPFPGELTSGLCVTVGGTADVTVFYR